MKGILSVLSLLSFLLPSISYSYDEPAVNLGYSSFLDGGPPSGHGLYFQDYFQYYRSNDFKGASGRHLPLPIADMNLTVEVVQLIYLTHLKIFGGSPGISALLPGIVHSNIRDGVGNQFLDVLGGVGNLFIGPALQFDPLMRKDKKGPLFVHRIEVDAIVPTGHYDRAHAVTAGSNFWSINPYWATTFWFTPKWSFSSRLHYLWNSVNNDPSLSFGPFVRTVRAGEAFFGDLATEYEVVEKWRVGINGYFFDQVTDTRINGYIAPGRREQIWAIGPGMLVTLTKNQFLFMNLYFEEGARNRPQGTNLILRYAVHFPDKLGEKKKS